jgi:hypothetical protein
MKTQLLQDLQESGSAPPPAGQAVPAPSQPTRKPIVLADEPRTPAVQPPQRPAGPVDEVSTSSVLPPQQPVEPVHVARTPSVVPSQRPAVPGDETLTSSVLPSQPPVAPVDDAHAPPDRPHRPAVWHGPAAHRVDAGTPGQRLVSRVARRAPDIAARGAGVAIEAWAERAAQGGAGASRPASMQLASTAPGPARPTMDVAAFFGRDEQRGAARPAGHESAAPTPHAPAPADSDPGRHVAPALPDVLPPPSRAAPFVSTQDTPAGAAAVPRRPHIDDVPPADAGHAPAPVRSADAVTPRDVPAAPPNETVRPHADVPGVAAQARVPAGQPDETTLLRAGVPGIPAQEEAESPLSARAARTAPLLEDATVPFPVAAEMSVPLWRRLWKRRLVTWSVAGLLAVGAGASVGWLLAGSRDGGVLVAADSVPAASARGAQAYAAREPAASIQAPPAAPAPAPAPAPVSPVDAVKPPPPAEPEVKPAPASAPDVAPAASRSVATVDLDPPKRAARHAAAAAARKKAAAKAKHPPVQEVRPAPAEPSPRERREETLMQCRAHGYDERQCIRRGCAMTRYGFACRG